MENKTQEEATNHVDFNDGLEVLVEVSGLYSFKGKIVGIASRGFNNIYLVECTDGFLPNETYNYKVASVPLSNIFKI
jgi:hypothetical protein